MTRMMNNDLPVSTTKTFLFINSPNRSDWERAIKRTTEHHKTRYIEHESWPIYSCSQRRATTDTNIHITRLSTRRTRHLLRAFRRRGIHTTTPEITDITQIRHHPAPPSSLSQRSSLTGEHSDGQFEDRSEYQPPELSPDFSEEPSCGCSENSGSCGKGCPSTGAHHVVLSGISGSPAVGVMDACHVSCRA